jgi:hypothetical protein
MAGSERDRDAAGAPDSPLDGGVGEVRWGQERHPGFVEVLRSSQQRAGDACRGREQLGVGVSAAGVHDGDPMTKVAGSGDEREVGTGDGAGHAPRNGEGFGPGRVEGRFAVKIRLGGGWSHSKMPEPRALQLSVRLG